MIIKSARFVSSSTSVAKCPKTDLPEYAFIGRSNVGKSSLINLLTNRTKLAKTSVTPGKTRLINHFLINDEWFIVDLPGYGFAKVAQSVKKDWGDMIAIYLKERSSLAMVVLILDIRRDPSEDDLSLRDWLEHYRIPYLYVLTKTDKLSNNQTIARQRAIERTLDVSAGKKPILFSAITQKGKDNIWQFLEGHLNSLPQTGSNS